MSSVSGRMGRWRRLASLLWLVTTRVIPTRPWYNGLGVDLGGGRVVQLYCVSIRPELVVVDVGDDGVAARVVGTVRKHEPSGVLPYRRACTAGAHLVLPGCVWAGSAPVDIVRVAAADPAAWSHVRRYTIPDMECDGHPCVVGGQIVLVYRSYTSPHHLRMRVGR